MTREFHDAMKIRTLRDQQTQNIQKRNINILSDRVMRPPEYTPIQNIRKSNLNKTVSDTLEMSRDKQYIAKNLDKTLHNLDKQQIKDFKNKI